MMFKGHALRRTCLGLIAALFLAATVPASAQGSWRILIVDKETEPRAQEAKRLLDMLRLPAPTYLDQVGGGFRITYGDYTTPGGAETARKVLYEKEKIFSTGVVNVPRPAAAAPAAPSAGGEIWTIFVRDFKDQAEADKLKTKLQAQFGDATVMIRQVGTFYEVYVGQYDAQQAAVAMGQVRQMGFTTAQAKPLPPAPQAAPAQVVVATPIPQPAGGIDERSLPIQKDEWNKLSEEQKQKVLSNAELQAQIRKGDPLASKMFDITKRIESLDDQVKRIVKDIDSREKDNEKKRREINTLIEDAENLIKSREADKYKEARLKLDQAANLDKENIFGQRNVIQNRIAVVDSLLKGLDFPGQDSVNAKRIKSIEAEINQLKASNEPDAMRLAISKYMELIALDPNNYKTPAETAIRSLQTQISNQDEEARKASADKEKKNQYILYGMAGAVGALFVIVMLLGMRSRKRHQELMRKVQEITSIRPMRELEGSGAPLLGGTDTDIFTPATSAGEGGVGDPLGGVLTPPPPPDKKGKKKGKGGKEPAPAAPVVPAASDGLDDIFGGGDPLGGGVMPDLGGGDGGLDDIFGAPTPATTPRTGAGEPSTMQSTEPPTAKSTTGSDIDDIFGGLFSDDSHGGGQGPAAQPVQPEPADADDSPAHDTGPIKFGEYVSPPAGPAAATETSNAETDLLAVFDEPTEGQAKANGQGVDSLEDSPFASMFNDAPPPAAAGADDSEIPSIRLDKTGGGDTTAQPSAFSDFSLDSAPNPGGTGPAAESLDLPAFSFDDLVGATSVNLDATPGAELDFEQDPVGQAPNGWSGQYPFATLSVEGDTPPKGARQYLRFSKPEGSNKAHYSYRFGEVTGIVGIEFDLRCNDKNKFLLGFYVEKDGDFQQSVHTKILRSEAQTSPSIHMQGQSAPYLLGSWTHIKYVVDLKAGKINGYIDSTHVVRDLPLAPNPGSLNTLSIRDNINTTGVLLLDNIRVYPMP